MTRFLLVALGAALGANLRYWLGEWVSSWGSGRLDVAFPYATLLVNVVGSLVLGFLVSITISRFGVPVNLRLILAVGFLGSFTTFSSYVVDTLLLIEDDDVWYAVGNVLANNGLGMAAAFFGYRLGSLSVL